jgi:adenosine deaminase
MPDSDQTYGAYLDRMPKVELHCHLIGTVRPETFAELSARAGLELPADPLDIFQRVNSRAPDHAPYAHARIPVPEGPAPDEPVPSYPLFQVSNWVKRSMTRLDDFSRIAYEALVDARTKSNTRYAELFVDPVAGGVWPFSYPQVVDAYLDGMRAAEADHGIRSRLIAAIDRSRPGSEAVAVVQQVIEHRRDEVVGIGLDNLETAGPPERFVGAYQLARKAGLRRTAHSSEHAPTAVNTVTCLDQLHCDRIDHGYFILEDDAVVERCRDQGVPFTCIFTTSRRSWRPWRRASIAEMVRRGITVTLSSDDPGMFPTTLAREYRIAGLELGFDRAQMRKICLDGVAASWLDEGERAQLAAEFGRELDALEEELYGPGSTV